MLLLGLRIQTSELHLVELTVLCLLPLCNLDVTNMLARQSITENLCDLLERLSAGFGEEKEVNYCGCKVRCDKERIESTCVRSENKSKITFFGADEIYLQLTFAIAIGVIWDRTMATTALENTANARPFVLKKKGNSSDGTTQIMALKNTA